MSPHKGMVGGKDACDAQHGTSQRGLLGTGSALSWLGDGHDLGKSGIPLQAGGQKNSPVDRRIRRPSFVQSRQGMPSLSSQSVAGEQAIQRLYRTTIRAYSRR